MNTRRNYRDTEGRRGGGKLPRYASTMYALHKWYQTLCEKLGWIVIAKAKGYDDKVAQYKRSIAHFLKSAEHLKGEYEDHNRQHDLNVLHMNVKELQNYVNKNL